MTPLTAEPPVAVEEVVRKDAEETAMRAVSSRCAKWPSDQLPIATLLEEAQAHTEELKEAAPSAKEASERTPPSEAQPLETPQRMMNLMTMCCWKRSRDVETAEVSRHEYAEEEYAGSSSGARSKPA